MAAINLTGLNSGIDTGAIVQQLLAVEGRRLALLQNQQTSKQTIQTNLNTLQSKLSAFQTAVKAIDNAQTLRSYNATSSDSELVTAAASYNAFEGNHTVEIHQLASAERIVHAGTAYAEDLVGAGTFIYSYNHKETTITTTDTTTLNDLVGLINNDPTNPGVTASILKYDDGNGGVYHLVLGGNDSGADYNISINTSNTNIIAADTAYSAKGSEATGATKITDIDGLLTADKITIAGAGRDGTPITPVELTITHDTTIDRLLDEINSAYGGTITATIADGKIRLTDNTNGASLTDLTLTFSAGGSELKKTEFSATFEGGIIGGSVNATLAGFDSGSFLQTQAAANAQLKVDGYPPDTLDEGGNPVEHWIERSSNTLDDIIQGVTLNLHAPTTAAGVQVNLTRQTDAFKDKLNAMVNAYNEVVTFIKEQTAYDASTKTAGPLMGNAVVGDILNQLKLPFMMPVSGFTKDVDSFIMPGHIGLSIDSEGKLTLDETKLDDAITKDYSAVLDLIGAMKTGSSNSNSIKFYGASDNTTAGTYNVEVTFESGVITGARTRSSSESAWRTATWTGNSIIGNSQFDAKGRPLYPENGLSLTAEYSGSGTLATTIQVKQGFAGTLEKNVKAILNTQSGELKLDQNAVSNSLKQLQERIDREQARLTRVETALKARFARMEAVLAQLQQQQAAIAAM